MSYEGERACRKGKDLVAGRDTVGFIDQLGFLAKADQPRRLDSSAGALLISGPRLAVRSGQSTGRPDRVSSEVLENREDCTSAIGGFVSKRKGGDEGLMADRRPFTPG